jgi:hypothetical protein
VNRWTAAAVAALVLLPLTSCDDGDQATEPYTLELDGRASVVGEASLRDGEHLLAVGDTLRLTSGSATLALPGDATLELRAGPDGAVLEIGAVPRLVDGDALLLAGDEGLRLRAGPASIDLVGGAARVRRASGVNLAVYHGRAAVSSLGSDLSVRALRQTAISDTGALPARPMPLLYDRSHPDPWDVRFLGDAIELGTQLERRSRAITVQATRPDSDVELVSTAVPSLGSVGALAPGLVDPDRSLGETVVGASIALGGEGSFRARWEKAFDLRDRGADWGLVALDQQAEQGRVLDLLDDALDRLAPTVLVATPRVPRSSTLGTSAGIFVPAVLVPTTTTTTAPAVDEPEVDDPDPVVPPVKTPPKARPPKPRHPIRDLLDSVVGAAGRPTEGDDPDVRSADDDRRDGRRGHRSKAVLDGFPRLRPVRGQGVPGRGGDDDGRLARARAGIERPDRRGRGAHDRRYR